MDVVPAVAVTAEFGHIDFVCYGPYVAGVALQIFVRTIQFEIRLSVVIKTPEHPAVGVVACTAFRPQALFMRILFRVTGRTGAGSASEYAGHVTFLAGDDGMLPDKRKPGEVVIEPYVLRPAFFAMAAFAPLSELVLVNIVGPVTIDAALAGLVLFDRAFVAGFTLQFPVLRA